MSSQPSSPSTSKGQQTLYAATAAQLIDSFPRGVTLRYEPTDLFKAFLVGNRYIRYVVINVTDALKIIRDHGSLHAILEDWQVPIVTATDPDLDIYERQYDDIRHLLKHIQPAIYIPDAGTVYWKRDGQSQEESERSQRRGIRVFIRRLDWVMETIQENNWDISVLPLAKGMYRWHYEMLRNCYVRHGFSNYAFYTKQYTNNGNHIRKLLDHMQNLIDVMDAENVFAIARLGENHLERFPPQVTGACGIVQFAKECKEDGQFIEDRFVNWRARLEETLLDKSTVIRS